jgi:AraC family transcriptional regulator
MMRVDFLERMTRVADFIEEHLTDDMRLHDLASIVSCDIYQFGRIFAYVVGIPLSEYVRRRRLSQAALELQGGEARVIDVALRYGYASPDAFARAFAAMHGVTPREAIAPGTRLRLYPRITFHISIKGDADMEYRIEQRDIMHCVGIEKNFGIVTVNRAAEDWTQEFPDIMAYWDQFLDGGANPILRDQYRLYRAPLWQVGVTETLPGGETVTKIGAEARPGEDYPELTRFDIPAHTWAIFTARGRLNQKVHPAGQTMARVLTEWLPVSGYELIPGLHLEIYGPGDTQKDDYACELWLPVKKL